MRTIRMITLCSGYDSQMMAARRLMARHPGEIEFDLIAWAEIDKFAIQAHNAVFPEYADRNVGDITKADWTPFVGKCDLLTYSTPCQSISVAGKQAGLAEGDDAASALIWEVRRAIETLRPKYLIFENVANILAKRHIKEFVRWCKTVESFGYVNFRQVMDAKDYGVPQHRERMFMVSILQESGNQANTPPHYQFPKPIPLTRRLKDCLEPYGSVPESYYLKPKQVEAIMCDNADSADSAPKKKDDGYDSYLFGTEDFSKAHGATPVVGAPEIIQVGNVKSDRERFSNPEDGRVYSTEGISPTMKRDCYRHPPLIEEPPRIIIFGHVHGRRDNPNFPFSSRGWIYDPNGIIKTLTATDWKEPPYIVEQVMINGCDNGELAPTIRAGYYKTGGYRNVVRKDGFVNPFILEKTTTIDEVRESTSNEPVTED